MLNEEPKQIIGCHADMPNEVYHGMKSYISRSSLMDFDKSPYTYWAKHLNPERPTKDATPQMLFGSLVHTYFLERHLYLKQYTLRPPKVLLKDVGREKYEEYKAICEGLERDGKIVIDDDDYQNLLGMEKKLASNPQVAELLGGGRIENSFFWQDEGSGLFLKCRPDVLQTNMIVDLKTSSDASPRAFQYEMVKYGYHVQFAIIRDGVEKTEGRRINNFINVVIETKYPYNMAIYIVDEEAVDAGEVKYKQLCLELKDAVAKNTFNDYGIQTIGLPKWAS